MTIKTGNGAKRISFSPGYHFDSTAIYSTIDPEEQEAMESASGFMRDYYLEGEYAVEEEGNAPAVVEEEKVEEIIPRDMLDSRVFSNLVEMKNALVEKGLDVSKCRSYVQVLALARDNGYDYKVEK